MGLIHQKLLWLWSRLEPIKGSEKPFLSTVRMVLPVVVEHPVIPCIELIFLLLNPILPLSVLPCDGIIVIICIPGLVLAGVEVIFFSVFPVSCAGNVGKLRGLWAFGPSHHENKTVLSFPDPFLDTGGEICNGRWFLAAV